MSLISKSTENYVVFILAYKYKSINLWL